MNRSLSFLSYPVVAVACLVAQFTTAAGLGDSERGQELFGECSGCHAIGTGAEESVEIGPHLNSLFGRTAASLEHYRYSESLIRAGANGLEWQADTLDAYIKNPYSIASGTRMSFNGLSDQQQRDDLIAYLRLFSDDPADFPEAAPTANPSFVALAPEILAEVGDAEYGEYLSAECKTCHQASGESNGIPSIIWWPEEKFVAAMHAYKEKLRPNQVMQLVASRLSNEEIAALAAYFKVIEE